MKILILDDDQDLLYVCRLILENDYTIVTHENCNNIVDLVEREKPDLILMDCWILCRGGVNATKLLKAIPKYQNMPIILFSAINNLNIQAIEAGADGYIRKPFEMNELKMKIGEQLRKVKIKSLLTASIATPGVG